MSRHDPAGHSQRADRRADSDDADSRAQGTDLAYINELADKVGYVFYLDPGPAPGTNIAYWGPEIKVGVPQPALNIDMDAHTNVESLSFTFNNNLNAIPTVFYYEELTKAVDPDPDSADHAAQPAARPDSADSHAS